MANEEQAHTTRHAFVQTVNGLAGRAEVLGLHGCAAARFLAGLLTPTGPALLVVVADLDQARQLTAELAFFSARPEKIRLFPHWEMAPFEPLVPHSEIEATRLATLYGVLQGEVEAVVTTPAALQQRVIPRQALHTLCEELILEEEYDRHQLQQRLHDLGYRSVPLVEDRGTYSFRGDILDLFPPTLEQPVRIDFFGDYIERMRVYDALTQRSGDQQLDRLTLLPSREMVLTGSYLDQFSQQLKQRCDALELPRTKREAILEEVREGLLSPGRSFLLPLNYGQLDSLFDYLATDTVVTVDAPAVEQTLDQFSRSIEQGVAHMVAGEEPYVEPHQLYLAPQELEQQLRVKRQIHLADLHIYDLDHDKSVLRVESCGNGEFLQQAEPQRIRHLAERLTAWADQQWSILLVCRRSGQAQRLNDLLKPYELDPQPLTTLPWNEQRGTLHWVCADISRGFQLPDEKLVVVTEEEVFGQRVKRRRRNELRAKAALSSLAELKERDYVVHADHGIGLYLGLEQLSSSGMSGDFLKLEYAGGDMLYLPVERIEKVQKYAAGDLQSVRLDKMGGTAWAKTCQKARAAVEEMARELLTIYARREMAEAFTFSPPDDVFRSFEAAFPYEETADQMAAIQDVLEDMQSGRPMDRLICGDVGYGKTEVAIRAAFKAALDSKQVAVVVPTTILARQHYATFLERFHGYPVHVEMISRFRSAADQKRVLKELAEGQVDVVIGTHRLLQRDVHFKDLGMVVIDEEQRFGVSHKERLKKMRAQVAMLTLSATPIPRTLNMGMIGMRDLSIIDTPPVDRLAIRTYVTRFDDDLIRNAILRELQRGGQVYFVHNRVQSIGAMAEFLATLVPEAKIAVGHGQMAEKELEKVMLGFIEGETNVLVASTIIENGLDIPRANTIIVNRADCFGLSQLYQLRGRVGRSKNRGYAYLLIPGEATLTKDARARLQVLQDLTELGAGFRVASHDLELRGAGDLLGGRQAGQIAAIGFEMYTELLEETIQELKGMESEGRIDPEIRLGLHAFLPDNYVVDPNQRLVFYKKMAAAEDDATLYDIVDELQDRYGEIPQPGLVLLEMMKLRVELKRLRIDLAEFDGRRLVFGFHPTTTVSPDALLALIQEDPQRYSLSPDFRIAVRLNERGSDIELIEEAKKQLQAFCGP
ncbi:transcription-repair coupling factor [Desulfuromonas acetoxidans]|uniref:Transcription-repair-coupling factor n=1 Tax=Desulfuromonas acetoxidans (strain DSM 684 / 11070) TaxID=281689 RepID=Q1JZD4_DESA6|nr:transcription-repair coupling factor [Desulfuromonas acetoxidans]EAT15633.1 transcription-repair coupling factor [Desulfuromonas acetoxidans DSM 684]MBF0645740.1 transcription-repair coupling factor [Desulfuromonas acetoxidans]NVD25226.1 transcription-repair coupling factor [Desulfuromonas acetoxidans]NVE17152.1 transcription-repair coupling factor [Desulfuromonas acetoxidans]